MKKAFLLLAAIALVGFVAGSAVAQTSCLFNAPAKAKGFKSDMVRAFASCPGITQNINVGTGTGIPGCNPPFTLSSFVFGPKGKCSLKSSQKGEVPCSDGTADSCANLTLSAKCGDVRQDDETTPVSGPGWALLTVARTTFADTQGTTNDPSDDIDMTIIDFPIVFNMDDAKKGKFKVKANTNDILGQLFGPGTVLPLCTQIQVISFSIADPDGNIFAVMGSSTR